MLHNVDWRRQMCHLLLFLIDFLWFYSSSFTSRCSFVRGSTLTAPTLNADAEAIVVIRILRTSHAREAKSAYQYCLSYQQFKNLHVCESCNVDFSISQHLEVVDHLRIDWFCWGRIACRALVCIGRLSDTLNFFFSCLCIIHFHIFILCVKFCKFSKCLKIHTT